MKLVHNDPPLGSVEDAAQCPSVMGLAVVDGVFTSTRCTQERSHDGWCHDQYVTWPGLK